VVGSKNAKIKGSKIMKLTQTPKLRVAKIKGFTVYVSDLLLTGTVVSAGLELTIKTHCLLLMCSCCSLTTEDCGANTADCRHRGLGAGKEGC